MVGWTFENALAAIQSPPSIPFPVLLSMDGLRLGDICFAKIQMTLCMQNCIHFGSRDMDSERELQSRLHG